MIIFRKMPAFPASGGCRQPCCFFAEMEPRVLQISYNLAALPKAVHQLRQWADTASLFTLSGNLGAGKTTLIREWCRQLGVTDAVSSPTFSLVNEYCAGDGQVIYHMDFYRMRHAAEAYDAGLEELLEMPGALVFIEWPERAEALLPAQRVALRIEAPEEGERILWAERL